MMFYMCVKLIAKLVNGLGNSKKAADGLGSGFIMPLDVVEKGAKHVDDFRRPVGVLDAIKEAWHRLIKLIRGQFVVFGRGFHCGFVLVLSDERLFVEVKTDPAGVVAAGFVLCLLSFFYAFIGEEPELDMTHVAKLFKNWEG